MIEFKPVTIADKELITSYILPSGRRDCDSAFANMCSWHFYNEYSYAIVDGHLVIRMRADGERMVYSMPYGDGNRIGVIERLMQQSREDGQSFYLRGIFPESREILEKDFPTIFEYEQNRDYADYLYLRTDLVELKGKNYHQKRNHVNQFRKEYDYRYEPLTPGLFSQCMDFESEWCMAHGYVEDEGLKNERRALTFALRHFEELGLIGGSIFVNDKMVAFTFGSPITNDTFGVHFEKADIQVDGAYNIINQEFAAHIPEQYIYLNREEDLGKPGLRQAKLSYHPVILLEKGIAMRMEERK